MTNSPTVAATIKRSSPVIPPTTGTMGGQRYIPVSSPSMSLSQGHSTFTDEAITGSESNSKSEPWYQHV